MPSSSLVDATLAQLDAGRFQQLSQFKTSLFSSKQRGLPEHPAVELFLRSNEKSMTYDLANDEERKFVSKFFCRRLAGRSVLIADCNMVKTFVDGESKICVVIRKNWESSHSSPNPVLPESENVLPLEIEESSGSESEVESESNMSYASESEFSFLPL